MHFQSLDDEDDDGDFSFMVKGPSIPKSLKAPEYTMAFKAPKREIHSLLDIYDSDEKIDWIIEGVLHDSALLYFGGASGSGKTILAIQSAIDLVVRRCTLKWKFNEEARPQKILMLSLEMNKAEINERIRDMYPGLTDDERKAISESFDVYCDGKPWEMWNTLHVAELHDIVKRGEYTGVLIDSASVSFAPQPNDSESVNKSIQNLYGMRNELNVWNMVIVHTRKPDRSSKAKPGDGTMHDIMGHSGFAQSATTIILIEMEDEETDQGRKGKIKNAKNRFGKKGGDEVFGAMLPSSKKTEDGIPLQFMLNVPHILPAPKQKQNYGKAIGGFSMASMVKGMDIKQIMLEDDDI